MSWTIAKTPHNSKAIEALEKAINEAKDANILMFGAASDQGLNASKDIYPVAAGSVFCIGAAKESEKPEDVSDKESHYVFPGRDIGGTSTAQGSAKPTDEQPTDEPSSSIANALAAGLAALILHCVEITEPRRMAARPWLGKIDRKQLTTYRTMNSIFKNMAGAGNKYIPVQSYFDASIADKDWDDDGEDLLEEIVARIIRYAYCFSSPPEIIPNFRDSGT